MQLSLEFVEEGNGSRMEKPPLWESLEDAARQAAAARLTRLIVLMLVGARRKGEVDDD
jgi:hypothetical protein